MKQKSRLSLLGFIFALGCSSHSSDASFTAGGAPSLGAAGAPSVTGGAAGSGAQAGGTGGTGGGNGGSSTGGAASATTDAVVDTKKMAAEMGFGTNIGNTLDNTTAWETGWSEPLITQSYINGMASRGIKTVRVPVAWDTYATNGVLDPTKMARVQQVVSWIETAGMYSIVNIHWDGGWIDNDTDNNPNKGKLTSDVQTKFASYWTQIATAFSTVGHKLIFEGLNEESKFYLNGDASKPDYAALNTLNQLFVTTVRAQAGYSKTRALLIAGYTTDIALTTVAAFAIPSDPAGAGKLFLSIHYYTPYTFSGLDTVESWGSPQTTWGTPADQSELDGLFTQLGNFSTERNIPVIIGEFGVTLGKSYPRDPASRSLWMEAVAKAAFAHNMVPVLWDTGSEISRVDASFSATFQKVATDLKLGGN
ncbi:MAG TPA: glycoside hydrolase family 5 protein [Polyangiaceae bacterium]